MEALKSWAVTEWRHITGLILAAVLSIGLGLALFVSERQKDAVIARMDANVQRQERTRATQFADLRRQVAEQMQVSSDASDAALDRAISQWFTAAAERMTAVSDRRERALTKIGIKVGVSETEMRAIFAEPLPPYPAGK